MICPCFGHHLNLKAFFYARTSIFLSFLGDDDEEDEADLGSAGKKRRNARIAKVKKASGNKCGHIIT